MTCIAPGTYLPIVYCECIGNTWVGIISQGRDPTQARWFIQVITGRGPVDYPILYPHNKNIGYDRPERVPLYARPLIRWFLNQL